MRLAFRVEFSGGELRSGEVDQIRRELTAAARSIEPLMDVSVQVFDLLPGRGVVDGLYVTESD